MRLDDNKFTCLAPDKMFGRYQAIIMPCESIIMHGVEAVNPSSGTNCFFREASFAFARSDPRGNDFFGSLSA